MDQVFITLTPSQRGKVFRPGEYITGLAILCMSQDTEVTNFTVELIGVSKSMVQTFAISKKHKEEYQLIHEEQTLFTSGLRKSPRVFRRGERFEAEFSFKLPKKANGRTGQYGCDHKVDLPPSFAAIDECQSAEVVYFIQATVHRPLFYKKRFLKTLEIYVTRPYDIETMGPRICGGGSIGTVKLIKNKEKHGVIRGLFKRITHPGSTKFEIRFEIFCIVPTVLEVGETFYPKVLLFSNVPPHRYLTKSMKDGEYQSNGLGKIIIERAITQLEPECCHDVNKTRYTAFWTPTLLLSETTMSHEVDLADLEPTSASDYWFCKETKDKFFIDISHTVDPIELPMVYPSFKTDNIFNRYHLHVCYDFVGTYRCHGRVLLRVVSKS